MLRRLVVDNLTVIKHAELELEPGLTCITGETGAGKTMLTQAVRLVSGEKADARLVGGSGEEAYVEAAFDDSVPQVLVDVVSSDEELVLARRLRKTGSARALCSGRSCSADQLREATDELISLTGQHAARRLVDNKIQLALIDASGSLEDKRDKVALSYQAWRQVSDELRSLQEALGDRIRHTEMLEHEISLVRSLDPQPGEKQELEEERERLAHVEGLRGATALASHLLNGDEGAADKAGQALRELENVSAHDPDVLKLTETVQTALEEMQDSAREAQRLADTYDADPMRLTEIEQRLSAFNDLKRRFAGLDIPDILAKTEQSEAELLTLEEGDERLEKLEEDERKAQDQYDKVAKELRAKRQKAAQALRKKTEGHLSDLGLQEAKLLITFIDNPPSSTGIDKVEIMLQANPNLDATPLDKGASGGELSRVNLALLLGASDSKGSWIFDEVDAGIGGATAHVVASKLKALSATCQVIVVTHLAQIAVQADHHFVLKKEAGETSVHKITAKEDIERELARLIGADSDDKDAAKSAADLLRKAAA